jgi:putative transposase
MKPRHAVPLVDFDYRGKHCYHVTWCCDARKVAFTDVDAVELVRAQILRASEPSGMNILAYCYMPDHLHLLVEGTTATADAKRFFRLAKQYSGYHYARAHRNRLWQRYGYEHLLRPDQLWEEVAKYILENPIRAGLAVTCDAYPFTGSEVFARRELMTRVYGRV